MCNEAFRANETQQTFAGLEDVLKTCLENVFKTYLAQQFFIFQDVLKTY